MRLVSAARELGATLAVLASVALAGCAGDPGPCSELSQVVAFVDADGDGFGDDASEQLTCGLKQGYSAIGGDCNDADPLDLPGAAERCDALDNDCDGDVDEGMPLKTYFVDGDGDGVGSVDSPVQACDLPPGAALEPGDCDDARADVSPFATEICDGVDDDCDGRKDGLDPSLDVSTETTFYLDADGDGYGDPLAPELGCVPPADTVANADDCDDTDPAVTPGATEVCNDRDDDCDGRWDESDPDLDPSELNTYYFDADSDGYGSSASTQACTEPLFYVDNSQDCDDSQPLLGLPAPWLEDVDGDGVGAGVPSGSQCASPGPDWVVAAEGVDCAPADPAIHPDASEICGDAIDQDCDGLDLFCSVGLSDTCSQAEIEPVAFAGAWPVSADLGGFADNLNVLANVCMPAATSGTEGMVEVQLNPGELLTATSTDASADGVVYLVSDCTLGSTCMGAANNTPTAGATETLEYYNSTAAPLDVFAVFDCIGPTCGTVTGAIDVGQGDFLADTCAEAASSVPFEDGSFTLVANLAGFANDLSLPQAGCTSFASDGTEGFLPVTMHPNQTLSVTYQQKTADASVYLLTDCNAGNSCIKGSDQTQAGGVETTNYTNTSGADSLVYVGFDCFKAACNDFVATVSVK
jgi:hypothetical protein